LGGGNFGVGDPDLETLANVETNDASVLEFDFVPQGDSISFRYVFASEEYPQYVCGIFNDAFGFFLSGPGITGPYTNNAVNIALIPGSTIPVSINTVNSGVAGSSGDPSNCAALDPNWTANNIYFQDNTGSLEVEYNGQTVVLTARAQVICGETYHIKLAIADGGDTNLDSGVFLEENSFTSEPFIPILEPGPNVVNNTTILESCLPVTFAVTRENVSQDTAFVFVTLGGTATPDVDYLPAPPDTLVFLPGESVVEISFVAPIDDDGLETLAITLRSEAEQCAGVFVTNTFQFFLQNPAPLTANGDFETIPCQGLAVHTPTISGGFAPYDIVWSNGTQGPTIEVSPTQSTVYNAVITDDCGTVNVVQFIVDLEPLIPPVLTINGPSTVLEGCVGSSLLVSRPPGIGGPFFVSLSGTGGAQAGLDYSLPTDTVIPDGVDFIELPIVPIDDGIDDDGEQAVIVGTVTDACGRSAEVSATFTLTDAPAIEIEKENLLVPCGNDSVLSIVDAFGGVGALQVEWSNGYVGTSAFLPTSAETGYLVTATDECGRSASVTVFVELICDVVIPNVFTPNGDSFNRNFHIEGIQFVDNNVRVFDRWGKVVFEAKNYRNSWEARDLPDGTYFYEIIVDDKPEPYTGSLTILR
jgi:gliding motility-associated-like protein